MVFITAVLLLLAVSAVSNAAQCNQSIETFCYVCNSMNDKRCQDPFDYSAPMRKDAPTLNICTGCCVKMVTHFGTPLAQVTRTCTPHLNLNTDIRGGGFCRSEGNGTSMLCVCEGPLCNRGGVVTSAFFGYVVVVVVAIVNGNF